MATVQQVSVDRRIIHISGLDGIARELPYDHVVVALGAGTNLAIIPGSEYARTFKTAADAILLRNHIIGQLERADVESDPRRRRRNLTIVGIGGGLVGVELLGELTALIHDALRHYPAIPRNELRFHLFEAGPRLLHESSPFLGEYAARVLQGRGTVLHTSTAVEAIEPGIVRWAGGIIEADTIILAAGITPNAVAASVAVDRDHRGRIVTDAAMRSVSHPSVWAVGDCAAIPSPDGKPYPALAQHAIREGRAVAMNIRAAIRGRSPAAFAYRALGIMAAFGQRRAAADVRGLHLTGFIAWWLRRTYYLFQMPRWDTRLRIALDWTVSLLFRPNLTRVDLTVNLEQGLPGPQAGTKPLREPVTPLTTEQKHEVDNRLVGSRRE